MRCHESSGPTLTRRILQPYEDKYDCVIYIIRIATKLEIKEIREIKNQESRRPEKSQRILQNFLENSWL